jgi:hypothetical protein
VVQLPGIATNCEQSRWDIISRSHRSKVGEEVEVTR